MGSALVDAFSAATGAYVRWEMTPRWRRRKKRKRRARFEQLAADCDRIRDELSDRPGRPLATIIEDQAMLTDEQLDGIAARDAAMQGQPWHIS